MIIYIVLSILAITVLWGYAWVLMKIALDYMGPFTFSAVRFVIGSITMLLILYWRKIPWPKREDWLYLAILGLLQTSFVFLLVMYGMLFVGAGKSSVILYSMPIWSAFLAYFYLGEKASKRTVLGLLIGTAGLFMIIGWDAIRVQNIQEMFGELLIILASFSWAAANIVVKRKFQAHDKFQVSAWQMIIGTMGIVIAAFIMEGNTPIFITGWSIFSVVFCGLFASAFCFTVWYFILGKINTTTASVSLFLVPVFGLFFSWLQLGERITAEVLVGAALILTGIYLTTVQQKEKQYKNVKV